MPMKPYMSFILSILAITAMTTTTNAHAADYLCDQRYPHLCEGTRVYHCSGKGVKAEIKITALDRNSKYSQYGIAYQAQSRFDINGKVYSLKGQSRVNYVRNYLDRWGTWEPNHDRWLFNLFGADAPFNPRRTPLQLEVRNGGAKVLGYMAYHESAPPRSGESPLNFSCSLVR